MFWGTTKVPRTVYRLLSWDVHPYLEGMSKPALFSHQHFFQLLFVSYTYNIIIFHLELDASKWWRSILKGTLSLWCGSTKRFKWSNLLINWSCSFYFPICDFHYMSCLIFGREMLKCNLIAFLFQQNIIYISFQYLTLGYNLINVSSWTVKSLF